MHVLIHGLALAKRFRIFHGTVRIPCWWSLGTVGDAHVTVNLIVQCSDLAKSSAATASAKCQAPG